MEQSGVNTGSNLQSNTTDNTVCPGSQFTIVLMNSKDRRKRARTINMQVQQSLCHVNACDIDHPVPESHFIQDRQIYIE